MHNRQFDLFNHRPEARRENRKPTHRPSARAMKLKVFATPRSSFVKSQNRADTNARANAWVRAWGVGRYFHGVR